MLLVLRAEAGDATNLPESGPVHFPAGSALNGQEVEAQRSLYASCQNRSDPSPCPAPWAGKVVRHEGMSS